MTINHTPTEPGHDRESFEDRLLFSILENFDELTETAAAPGTPPARASRPARASHSRPRVRRHLAWAVPATAAVAGVAVLIAVDSPGSAQRSSVPAVHATAPSHPAHVTPAVRVSPGHRVLYRLAAKSLEASPLTGRYAILSEVDTETDQPGVEVKRTSVDDTLTGASTTYQTGFASSPGVPTPPAVLKGGPESDETLAYFQSLPSDPTALRSALLSAAKAQYSADNAALAADAAANAAKDGVPVPAEGSAITGPTPTDDEFVYQQASNMLWSPIVPPALRSALYKVLAGCQNVTVNENATDPSGRPAIEISQADSANGNVATYEDPSTGAVLAQQYSTGTVLNDEVYAPVTSANAIPADPYGN